MTDVLVLQWRKWKRERAKGNAGSAPAPSASRAAPVSAAPAAAAPSARPPVIDIRSSGKGKEEVVGGGAPRAVAVAPVVAVPAASAAPAKVPLPAAAGGEAPVSSAGEKWVADLHAATEKGKKELRQEVLAQTRAILAAGKYTTDNGATVELDTAAAAGRTVFENDHKFGAPPAPYNTTAHFVKADAIDTALFLIEKKGVNPLVVVPSDPKNIGGGFAGSSSLEEQLYRRTTALLAVEGDFKYDIPNHGAIYLPSIQVFRDGESRTGYQLVKAPRKVAFLLASSLERPKYEPKGRSFVLDAEARTELEAKVSAILSAGIEKGHDAIVLSAFGCGFNQAPPQAVAAVFRDLLTGKFSNTYKHVTFAILEDENCMKAHNPNGNLVPFQQEFLTVSKSASAGAKGKCCSK